MDLLAQFRAANEAFFDLIFLPKYCKPRNPSDAYQFALGLRATSRKWRELIPSAREVLARIPDTPGMSAKLAEVQIVIDESARVGNVVSFTRAMSYMFDRLKTRDRDFWDCIDDGFMSMTSDMHPGREPDIECQYSNYGQKSDAGDVINTNLFYTRALICAVENERIEICKALLSIIRQYSKSSLAHAQIMLDIAIARDIPDMFEWAFVEGAKFAAEDYADYCKFSDYGGQCVSEIITYQPHLLKIKCRARHEEMRVARLEYNHLVKTEASVGGFIDQHHSIQSRDICKDAREIRKMLIGLIGNAYDPTPLSSPPIPLCDKCADLDLDFTDYDELSLDEYQSILS